MPTLRLAESDTYPPDGGFDAWGHATHWHTFGQFIYAAVGYCTVVVGERTLVIDPSVGAWIPAGVPHSARFSRDFVPIVFALDGGLAGHTDVTPLSISAEIRAELLLWHREPDDDKCALFAAALLGRLRPAEQRPLPLIAPCGSLTAPVAESLRAQPNDARTLDEWARLLHTSSASIRRAFRAETGMPFSQWRTMLRLNASLPYLRGGLPVSVVANRVGFESSNGYAMAFRRHFACRPTEFARTTSSLAG
ncbi:MAG: AraC family transcriptional regulator [Nakamurella sp.]